MEQLYNGYTLEFSQGSFPLSTDSIALADFVSLPKNAAVLDLGSGCGTLGLYLCAGFPDCTVTGIELDEGAHAMALHNAKANGISSRLNSICSDLATVPTFLPQGSFHCCVSNPPYFAGGPKSKTAGLARREDACSLETLFQTAAWAVKYGGDFFLVHRPERLAELCATGTKYQLEAKRLCLLKHRHNGPISLVLLQFRKGGKPGLLIQEQSLYDENGNQTDYYRALYHL